ncbi:MAG: c-type cytochrome [Pseudomonadales bacterium]
MSPLVLSCLLSLTLLLAQLGFAAADAKVEEVPFYLTLDPPPAPELTPTQALAQFTLAPGFEITLVAAEPLVEDPVVVRWDEHGNLYVVEMRGFMPDAYGNNQDAPIGAVVRLKDTDRDGIYEQREVLLDKLILPRAIAIVNEGLLIAEPPHLWLCPSATQRSADISCADKVDLGRYGDQPGSVEHAENGLLLALDNWLYSAKSDRRLRLKEGRLLEEKTLFRGQWGITQDNLGRLFYNTNSNLLLGDGYDAQRVVAAGNRRAPGLGQRVSRDDQLFAVRVNPGVNRAYVPGVLRADGRLNRPTSASGMTIYRGDQFGPGHRDDAYVTEPAANAVVRLKLKHRGLQLGSEHVLYSNDQWGQVEFLASTDERFRPVDVSVGPDGALYVVDMYRGIIQDHVFLTEELRQQALARQLDRPLGKGRIWRVTSKGSAYRPFAEDLAQLSSEDLLQRLASSNGWQRDTAQRLLIARQDDGLKRALNKAVRGHGKWQVVHALWVLEGRGELDRPVVLNLLARADNDLRVAALTAGGGLLKRSELLTLFARSKDERVRQQTIAELARFSSARAVQQVLLAAVLDGSLHELGLSAVKAALHQHEISFLTRLINSDRVADFYSLVTDLVVQAFNINPGNAQALLDLAEQHVAQPQLVTALLDGMFAVSRFDGFQRAQLKTPHPLFDHPDEKLWPALARARRTVTWPGDPLLADAKPLTPPQAERLAAGQDYYQAYCATCHGADGQGIASLAPPLVDSDWVTGSTERLVRVLLHGLQGRIQVGDEVWDGVMPGHGAVPEFTDDVAAGLVTFLHRAWGHTGRAVEPEFIAAIRAATHDRKALWTAAELADLEVNTHYRRYAGRYGRPESPFEFSYDGKDLLVKSAIFNGPLRERKEDHFYFEPRELRLEFEYADSGEVNAVRVLNAEGGVSLPKLPPALD